MRTGAWWTYGTALTNGAPWWTEWTIGAEWTEWTIGPWWMAWIGAAWTTGYDLTIGTAWTAWTAWTTGADLMIGPELWTTWDDWYEVAIGAWAMTGECETTGTRTPASTQAAAKMHETMNYKLGNNTQD